MAASNLTGKITARHEKEIDALVEACGGDVQAVAKNVFVAAVFTAGRVMGAAQVLDAMKAQ